MFTDSEILEIRKEFPILTQKVNGKTLIYFDNGATTQKPLAVIDGIVKYYSSQNANIHRGVHYLSASTTTLYENSRKKIAKFINARSEDEIIFTRGTTESINLVAFTWGLQNIKPKQQIIVSEMEHHSNIVPWQMLCEKTQAQLKVIPIDDRGQLRLEVLADLLKNNTAIVCVNHVSNALGTVNEVKQIAAMAHEHGALCLVDGAQAVAHDSVDVQDIDCDFYAFSGHKMYGPTGIGVLYGKKKLLEEMPPYQGGGEMIKSVSFEKTVYNDPPARFEAGTPHIEGAICLGAAIDFMSSMGLKKIKSHEAELLRYAQEKFQQVDGVRVIGTAEHKAGLISFTAHDAHPHDLGTLLDQEGIAIRTGHHCAQPVLQRFQVNATARISFAVYNTIAEIDFFFDALYKALKILR